MSANPQVNRGEDARAEEWTFRVRMEDSQHGYFEVEIPSGPEDEFGQLIQPPWGEPMVPASLLAQVQAERDEWEQRYEELLSSIGGVSPG